MLGHPADLRSLEGGTDSESQSDQQVPIAPDPGSNNAGQITQVQKTHIRFRGFEVKLDLFKTPKRVLP
jgi:hypothetical protein